jgi:CTP synthase (UTP-ammonia lyase)
MIRVALIGDFDPGIVAHRAIPLALKLAGESTGIPVIGEWIATDRVGDASRQLADHAGVWCVPGSPYRSMEGAFAAIRFARENQRAFLGTCGGFQHALIEFARNVAALPLADHAETNAGGTELLVTPLACSLVGYHGDILFTPGSQLHAIHQGQASREDYHCNYGANPLYRSRLEAAGLRFGGFDGEMQIRALELPTHPFFIGTLFQPERSALSGRQHPLIQAFVKSAASAASRR